MRVDFDGISVQVFGDPATCGQKEFDLTTEFWQKWNKNKGLCKAHGFDVQRENDEWVGIYHPYAIFAEGTKRLNRESSEKSTSVCESQTEGNGFVRRQRNEQNHDFSSDDPLYGITF